MHGAAARTRPSRPRARPTRTRRSRTSRGSSSSRDDLAAAGLPPVPRAVRDHARRGEHALQPCIRCATCDGFPCLVHAKSDAEVLGVRPALEHANVTLLTNAKVVRLDTNDAGTAVTEVVVERDGAERAVRGRHRRRRLRGGQHGQAAARSPRATSTRTGSPTAPTRSAATTCSTTPRPCSRSRARRTRPASRRRSGSTTSTSASDDFEYPLGQHPDGRQVAGGDVPRREAAARRSSRPSGRSSGWRATRSTSGSRPRICRGPTTASPSTATASSRSAYTQTNARRRSGCTAR